MNGRFVSRFYLLCLALVGALAALVLWFATKHVSQRAFGIAVLVLAAVFFFVFLNFFHKTAVRNRLADNPNGVREPGAGRKMLRKLLWKLRIAITVLPLLLLNELWNSRGGPLLPRLGAATINLLLTAVCFRAMKWVQAQLKQSGETI